MTNLGRIKNMTAEEMAKTIKAVAIRHLCDNMLGDDSFDIKAWLESEVEEDDRT